MENEREFDTVKKVTAVANALKNGTLVVRQQDSHWVEEVLSAPRDLMGLVNIKYLSPKTIAIARASALAVYHLEQSKETPKPPGYGEAAKLQVELFGLFEAMFAAMTGVAAEYVGSEEEVRSRFEHRIRHESRSFEQSVARAEEELRSFYNSHKTKLFGAARQLGGLKTVLGGQRAYTGSAIAATRISGLYVDTQLIPDPVLPFFLRDLHLNASIFQLTLTLYHILQLKPLVDAQLPEPVVFIFPSFEESLEENDLVTKAGIAHLALSVLRPACDARIESLDELFEYAARYEDKFAEKVLQKNLFIPPGQAPGARLKWPDVIDEYLECLKGVRNRELLEAMRKTNRGVLLANGVIERIRPQYHLLENADELTAQPLLCMPAHWHYFEVCSGTAARELVEQRVLNEQTYQTLRAMHDDSLGWLANVPVRGLLELRIKGEHVALREELKRQTSQLAAAGGVGLDEVVREVNHGLSVLVQRQQKAIKEVEERYKSKYASTVTGALLGAGAGAAMLLMPSLALVAGITAPAAAAVGALVGGGGTLAKEKAAEVVEKRNVSKTLVGMLATARNQAKP